MSSPAAFSPTPLTPAARRYAMLAVSLSISMATLDTSMTNTALPSMAAQLGVGAADVIGVVTIYQLVMVATMLPLAALAGKIGHRRVFLPALWLFLAASVWCGAAQSLWSLEAARAAQGLAAAALMGCNMALVSAIYRKEELGRGMGLNAMIAAASLAGGPVLASAMLTVLSWHWLFYVNVPFCLVALALAGRHLPRLPGDGKALDAGAALLCALAFGLAFALAIGTLNGWLVAYAEIPAIFATLAMGTLVYGIGRYFLFNLEVAYMPKAADTLLWVGQGSLVGIPVPIFLFAAVCLAGHLFLRYAKSGRYLRAVGDNILAARITGIPVRPVIVQQYVMSALIGYVAGIITAASVASMNTRLALSTYIYDVILVVVLGGIGLSGGRGGIRNVIVGTLLIGVLLNGMTIMDIQYTVQNVIKGVLLLTAIVIDTILNPRDEQTAQQGDI